MLSESLEVSPLSSIAVTVRQPWADLIASGRKVIETRSWPTKYRGPLYIHAAQGPVLHGPQASLWGLDAHALDYGAIVARVNLVDVRPLVEEDRVGALCDIHPNYWAWVLEDAVRLAPVACRGMQRLWQVPKGLVLA